MEFLSTEFILSMVEGLRMVSLSNHNEKCLHFSFENGSTVRHRSLADAFTIFIVRFRRMAFVISLVLRSFSVVGVRTPMFVLGIMFLP